jgi:hypothetical protein
MIPGSSRSWIAVKTIKSEEVPNYALIQNNNNDSNRNTFNKLLAFTTRIASLPAGACLLRAFAGHCRRGNTVTAMPFEGLPEGGYNL